MTDYAEGQFVQAYTVFRRGHRWRKGVIRYKVGERYMIDFARGGRGIFDADQIKPVPFTTAFQKDRGIQPRSSSDKEGIK